MRKAGYSFTDRIAVTANFHLILGIRHFVRRVTRPIVFFPLFVFLLLGNYNMTLAFALVFYILY